MFGRRKREEQAAAEAEREEERRALFERLAVRPENICPFLGLEGERAGYVEGISDEHRCFAFGDPIPLSAEQQTRVCQERGYGNCPRYLRGVLVIPTGELEALRRRTVPEPPPPPPPVAPPPVAEPEAPPPFEREKPTSRFPAILWVGILLLIVAIGSIGAYLLRDSIGIASTSPSTTPFATATPGTSAPPSEAPTPVASLSTPPPVAWGWVGCAPGEPCADEDVNRAEMALYLSNAFELAPENDDQFTDIADNQYRREINAVALDDLTVGCTATTYCPDGLVTREQMATFIVRAFPIPPTTQDFYTDDEDSPHERAINAVAAAQIMESCGEGTFCPEQTVTRGDTASYLNLALNFE